MGMAIAAPAALGGLMLGGGVLGAMDAYGQASSEEHAARQNRYLTQLAAQDVVRRGQQDAARVTQHGNQVVSEQRALLGASGVDISSGSALSMQNQTRMMAALDAATITNSAAREAWGLNVQASQYGAMEQNAYKKKWTAPTATLLGSAAAAGTSYYGMTR